MDERSLNQMLRRDNGLYPITTFSIKIENSIFIGNGIIIYSILFLWLLLPTLFFHSNPDRMKIIFKEDVYLGSSGIITLQ